MQTHSPVLAALPPVSSWKKTMPAPLGPARFLKFISALVSQTGIFFFYCFVEQIQCFIQCGVAIKVILH